MVQRASSACVQAAMTVDKGKWLLLAALRVMALCEGAMGLWAGMLLILCDLMTTEEEVEEEVNEP